ncbi:MAG: aspartate dehydrogenase [Candidatus Diapherotrites archaeon]|nr:aspartate dehydrogenase [Candidatus Diapherotrites archaeon]
MEQKKLRVGILGGGTIGSSLVEMMKKESLLELVFVFDKRKEKTTVQSLEEGLSLGVELVVEAASAEALTELCILVLEKADLLVLSGSAFADKKIEAAARNVCKKNGHAVFVSPGAILGLDGISAVKNQITRASITTTKNPSGFSRNDKKKTVLFEGSARKACELFPRNVNVAATLALNSLGFDKTRAKIVSDPSVKANTHEITVEGSFGKFYISVENKPSKNPKTSALAAYTTLQMIKNIHKTQPAMQ